MQQMQNQMAQQMSGKQNCQKPNQSGQGKMKKSKGEQLGNMRQLQEQLNKQIGELKKSGDQGKRPLSKDLAKIAAQQEALRRELQKLNDGKDGDGGKGDGKELKEIQQMMDETEKDIVNNQITDQTLLRQKEITTRLLEAENAQREQEWDNKRESNTASQDYDPSKKAFEAYKKARMKEIELLNTVPPQLNSYYRQKVKSYFESIE